MNPSLRLRLPTLQGSMRLLLSTATAAAALAPGAAPAQSRASLHVGGELPLSCVANPTLGLEYPKSPIVHGQEPDRLMLVSFTHRCNSPTFIRVVFAAGTIPAGSVVTLELDGSKKTLSGNVASFATTSPLATAKSLRVVITSVSQKQLQTIGGAMRISIDLA